MGPNKFKKLTGVMSVATQYRQQSLNKKHLLCEAMHVIFHSNFAMLSTPVSYLYLFGPIAGWINPITLSLLRRIREDHFQQKILTPVGHFSKYTKYMSLWKFTHCKSAKLMFLLQKVSFQFYSRWSFLIAFLFSFFFLSESFKKVVVCHRNDP